jgi:DNA-binding beta-propeller fold protein YncE
MTHLAPSSAWLLLGVLTSQLAAQQVAAQQPAAPAPVRRLIVLNKAEATASLFDPATRKEVALVPVGDGPHEVAASPDGRLAVVCNYGGMKEGSTLTVVDVVAGKAMRTIDLVGAEGSARPDSEGPREVRYLRPHGIRFLPDGRRVVVTSEKTQRLLVVDVDARKVERALATPQTLLHMVALAKDGAHAFGASVADGTLGTFTLDGSRPASVLKTGDGAEGIAVAPGSGEVWVGNRAADTVSIVADDGGKVLQELATARCPIRVAFTPDGACALVSCAEAGQVQVWSTKTRKLVHTIELLGDKTENSPLPIGICVEPEGAFAWIACNRGEWLAVVDLHSWSVVDRVPARKGPDGMAFAVVSPTAGPVPSSAK